MRLRTIDRVIRATSTTEGAGVRLKRSLGQSPFHRHDPFLLLDEFVSDDAADYIKGFPPHPHRGFETVTYMLEGHMLHEDHLGNQGHLQSGGVQWMTAGRGIIHSEMPQQESGRLHGFQLWLNLPAREKMSPPSYRDIPAQEIPRVRMDGGEVRVIAGAFFGTEPVTFGPVSGRSTDPTYLDVHLEPSTQFQHIIKLGYSGLIYPYRGSLRVADQDKGQLLKAGDAGLLADGETVIVTAEDEGAGFLFLTAKPLDEPVAQQGPFVMNTKEEIEQAMADYRNGTLTD